MWLMSLTACTLLASHTAGDKTSFNRVMVYSLGTFTIATALNLSKDH